ncbi:epidermal growth factor receptor-like isoform X3 [Styela clava]
MGILYEIIVLLCFSAILHLGYSQSDSCDDKICPQPLDCRYPKVVVELPDPYDKCCNITECICEGTASRLSSSHDSDVQYAAFLRYTNCTMIDGNLEIVYIHPKPKINLWTLEATKHIHTVTGYVLISTTYIHYIDLSSLRLIRGRTLYHADRTQNQACGQARDDKEIGYSLYIYGNYVLNDPIMGLRGILMPHLTEIMNGNVKIDGNRDLCYVDSIIWTDEILNKPEQKAYVNVSKTAICKCPSSCIHKDVDDKAHCWGNSTDLCQQFTRRPCRDKCTGRCNQNGGCCESYCAAGCIVEDSSKGIKRECHACKYFNNFGKCGERCPSGSDPSSTDIVSGIDKSKIRYELVWYCVPQCPSTRRIYEPDRRCVLTCPEKYYADKGYCKECPPGGCTNICYGLEAKIGPLMYDDVIHSGNIGNFSKNCTIIEGSLNFRENTFRGDSHCKIPAISDKSAFDVFENVEEITGFLGIESWPYEDLCIFKNLKRIRGYEKRMDAYSLLIMTDARSLRSLCLNSLQEIESGRVIVYNNPSLCNTDSVHWETVFKNPGQSAFVTSNAKKRKCLPCSKTCDSSNGCWGSSTTQCVTCRWFTDYTNEFGRFTEKWVVDPESKLLVPGHNVTNCVKKCNFTKGVYNTIDKKCFPCDVECNATCTGPGPTNCSPKGSPLSCKNVHYNGTCIKKCPVTHYPSQTNECMPCSSHCIDGGCDGPEDSYGKDGCSFCHRKYDPETKLMIYQDATCQMCLDHLEVEDCPLGCTYDNVTDVYACYSVPSSAYIAWIIVIGVLLIIGAVVGITLFRCRKTIRTMRKHIGEKIVGDSAQVDEFNTPLTPSGTAPNRAHLRIVKESELALGKTLGSGAFGAVYKAIWTPMHIEDQTIKIAVAVKQLKTFSNNNEIVDEAHVMASVNSPYLIRLLGMCLTEQVALITQLMPLGSLLEYVRDNKDNIGSRHMLTWCTQIAKGMQYLEEKHMVHRDLAARNVLVKTPHHVKITDFGLSKMLNATQSVYFAEGGKLPIKWLAIECITERKFSHQSDVWAFGVTCWEIFTFGGKPYGGVSAIDVLSLLERGDRLTQPLICTIDVYMILIKCWMVDPLSRPRFSELVNEYTQMCHDHTRYLVIKNDEHQDMLSPNPEEERRFFEQLIKEENSGIDGELMIGEPDSYLLSDRLNGEFSPHYTSMSPTTSSISYSVIQDDPEYQNQATIDREQGIPSVNGGASTSMGACGSSRGTRLFSRNTPSAQLPTPPANSQIPNNHTEMGRVLPRVSDSSNPDDVFAMSGHSLRNSSMPSKSMIVDMPLLEKGAESHPVRFGSSRRAADQAWSTSSGGRKDSEENPRYTEDPTTHARSSYIDPASSPSTIDHEVLTASDFDHNDKMLYDEDEYLLPTPRPDKSSTTDYFDPSKPRPQKSNIEETVPKAHTKPKYAPASLSNNTYLESGEAMPLMTDGASGWPVASNQMPQLVDEQPEYVNTMSDHEYLNWDGNKTDVMMAGVVNRENSFNRDSQKNPNTFTVPKKNEEGTCFNNEEYMTTDSGIGEDNQSILSASNGMHSRSHGTTYNNPSRNRQNSSLSSAGSSNGSLGPLISSSPLHKIQSGDEQPIDIDQSAVRYKPVPKPRQSVKRSNKNMSPNTVGLDNPEYMMLKESVSDSSALLEDKGNDT